MHGHEQPINKNISPGQVHTDYKGGSPLRNSAGSIIANVPTAKVNTSKSIELPI